VSSDAPPERGETNSPVLVPDRLHLERAIADVASLGPRASVAGRAPGSELKGSSRSALGGRDASPEHASAGALSHLVMSEAVTARELAPAAGDQAYERNLRAPASSVRERTPRARSPRPTTSGPSSAETTHRAAAAPIPPSCHRALYPASSPSTAASARHLHRPKPGTSSIRPRHRGCGASGPPTDSSALWHTARGGCAA
jgi:hypothetical protein